MYLNSLIFKRFLDEFGRFFVVALILPATHVEEVFVVALGFAFLGLVLLAEVSAAGFLTVEGIVGNEFAHQDEVAQVDGLVEFDVHAFFRSRDEEVGLEFLAKFLHQFQTLLQSFLRATHTDVLPHNVAEFLMDGIDAALALDVHQAVDFIADSLLCLGKFGQIGADLAPERLVGEVVLNRVRQNEIAVGQALHQRGSTEAVGTVVREVALADSKESRNGRLQFVIDPNAAHRVVDGGENHHRMVVFHTVDFLGELARIDIGDFLIHFEEVAVALHNFVDAEAVNRLREVEEHSQTGVVYAEAVVATLLGGTRSHVARHEVSESRIATLQIVVAVFFGNLIALLRACLQCLGVFDFLRHPDTTVVAQRLRHQRQFRLLVAVYGDTGRVNLNVRGIGEVSTLAIALDGGGAVAAHCVGREEVGIAVSTRRDDDRIGRETLQFTRREVFGDDATSVTIDNHEVFHFISREELYFAQFDLTAQRRIGTEQQLLTGLTLGVERTAHLCATERTVGQHSAVLASEGNTLRHTLVDDVVRHFCQTIDVGFAGAIVATLHRVVEQTIDRVAVVLIALGCIDTALCSNRVSTARRVLNAEIIDVEAHFGERSGCRSTGQTRSHDNHVELQFVFRVHKPLMSLILFPLLGDGSRRYF